MNLSNLQVAVKKCVVVFGYLSKVKTGWFAKTISVFMEAMKTLAKLKLLGKSESWWWRGTRYTFETIFYWRYKILWKVIIYFANIIINIYFLFFIFFPFFDHKRTKVWINKHTFVLGTEKIVWKYETFLTQT